MVEEVRELRGELSDTKTQLVSERIAKDIKDIQIDELKKQLKELKAKMADPSSLLEAIMGRGINWYDYTKLDKAARGNYYAEANRIGLSEVYTNEMKHYMADLVQFNAVESRDHNQTMNIRASIIALETFTNRLLGVENPDKEPEPGDPFSPL